MQPVSPQVGCHMDNRHPTWSFGQVSEIVAGAPWGTEGRSVQTALLAPGAVRMDWAGDRWTAWPSERSCEP